MVLVASAGYHRIQGIQIHLLQYPSQHILRHARVIDYTQRFSTATALHTLRDFLQGTRTQVIVYFHFRVAGKLEGIRLKIREAQSLEHQWQAAADHIIQIDQVTFLSVVRQADKPSADVDRQFQKRIVGNLFASLLSADLYSQVNVLVVLEVEIPDGRKPDRNNRTAQLLLIIRTDKLQLFGRNLVIRNEEDIFFLQVLGSLVDSLLEYLGIFRVQLADLLDQFLA